MPTEPRTANERYLYWGGVIAGLGAGILLGYGLHSEGYVNVRAGHIFILIPCGLAVLLGQVIARRGRRAKRETD